jgi:ribose transport system ATP-binding protein
MGENGAGKSTLMKVAGGVVRPDAGSVQVAGRPVLLSSPRDAARAGIQVVFQELTVLDDLDVAHNLLVGDLPVRWGAVDRRALYARAGQLLDELGVDLDPRTRAGRLGVGRKQLLELARAVAQRPRVLVLDEPTSSLGRTEEQVLFALVERLRRDGVGIAYTSHRMGEVLSLADRVTVLRDGRHVMTADASVRVPRRPHPLDGRSRAGQLDPGARGTGRTVLMGRGLVHAPSWRGSTWSCAPGRCWAWPGCSAPAAARRRGCSRARPALGGGDDPGRPAVRAAQRARRRAGRGLLPARGPQAGRPGARHVDRGQHRAAQLRSLRRRGLVSRRAIAERAATWVRRLAVRTPDTTRPVGLLSGGNQQKVALAKWLATGPRVVLLDEPTRGVDVGAKAEIHALVRELAASGAAVLVISSELPEVLAVSDRIAVMAAGRVTGTVPAAGATRSACSSWPSPPPASERWPRERWSHGRRRRSDRRRRGSARAARSGMAQPAARRPPVLGLLGLVAWFSSASPYFLDGVNATNLVTDASTLLVCAFGMTLVVLIGEIDLSVAPW